MDLSGTQVQDTTNYLVPSSGGTHCVPVTAIWGAQPAVLDWRQFSESSFPFMPQGVFVDNTQNANPLLIQILPLGWNINIPAGVQIMTPFPAPLAQTAQVSSSGGGGTATLMFVDFPVLPFQSSTNVGGGTNVTIVGQPITVLPANVASATALSTQPVSNVQLTTQPGEWTLTNSPVAATQATATRAAGAAGVRHVLKSIQASINAVAAQAAPVSIVVRDGASGSGTILWQDRLMAPIGFSDRITLDGLNIVGSAATAMTVEFTAAPAATNFETISATGFDAQG
jgi:hypothetical protein